DGAEERERDANAAEDEIFPRRLDRRGGAVDADHHHGREGRHLDADPEHADVVGDQRQVHGAHHRLIERMVEPQEIRSEPAGLELVADVARAEDAGGEADEGRERDQIDVEIVDEQHVGAHTVDEQQRKPGRETQPAGHDVDRGAPAIVRDQRQHQCRDERDQQDRVDRRDHDSSPRSPRNRSSALTSTVSKRSRMRNTNTPNTMKAIRIENATENSTTSGMPLAPVAASTSPFSSDMKPTIWVTALRRVIIISRPSRITASAKARSSRASGLTPSTRGSTSMMAKATMQRPSSISGPAPTTCSISRWMLRRRTMRCSAAGM